MRPGPRGTPGEELWHEAAAGVQSSLDAYLRDEAYEMFVAEAARCRLVDRVGHSQVSLRCGVTLVGELEPDCDEGIDEHLALQGAEGDRLHVPIWAIVAVTGSRPTLRVEGQHPRRSLTSWLRECWSADGSIRLLDGSGRWVIGRLDFVGADHVEVAHGAGLLVVPVRCVEAWQRG